MRDFTQVQRGLRHDPNVARVQGLLRANNMAWTDSDLEITGSFGPATEQAVVAFQEEHELTADGVVGTATWSKLLGL